MQSEDAGTVGDRPPALPGGGAAWVIESAAQLGRARSVEVVRGIVAGMGSVLLGAEVTIETSADFDRLLGRSSGVPVEGSDGTILAWLRATPSEGREFSEEDRRTLAQLARLTATRLESLRLYEREHRLATTLQTSIIPERLPELPGLLLAAHYSPASPEAEVGGDWYDALALPGGPLAIAVGDVVGRGVHAAAIMGQLRNAFRAFLLEGYRPADALGRLNGLVNTLGDAYFCTVACVLIDPARGFARVASAGHMPPVVVTAGGAVRFQDLVPSIAIGATADATYSDTALMLHPGDTLLLYTDGLIERRHQPLEDGLDRLADAAASTGGDPAILVEHLVHRMMETGDGEDDVAAIAMTAVPAPTEPLHLRVPALPRSLAGLRNRLRAWLRSLGLGENDVFDVVLAGSEAAANAIEHPSDPTSTSITVWGAPLEGRVVVSVKDSGRWKDASPSGDRGRGLGIIEALLERPKIERSSVGTTVTFRAPLPEESRS